MRLRPTRLPLALLSAAALLGGCSSTPSAGSDPSLVTFAPEQYEAAFDAARDELRARRFVLNRVDAAAGVITTLNKPSSGLATPWDSEQSTPKQELEDWLNQNARSVRITFEPAPDVAPPDQAPTPTGMRVEVVLHRTQTQGLRPSPKGASLTSLTTDPSWAERSLGREYQVPVTQDPALARRLADGIRARLVK